MALTLSRKAGQWLRIGSDIGVCFCGLDKHGEARITIKAPKHIQVIRDEATVKLDLPPEKPAQPKSLKAATAMASLKRLAEDPPETREEIVEKLQKLAAMLN